MGRRHLAGLVTRGYAVDAVDPSEEARNAARAELDRRKIDQKLLNFADGPQGDYAVAAFSEHADRRFGNVTNFLAKAKTKKVLLEKPLSSDPAEIERLKALLSSHGVDHRDVAANLVRRAWPSSQQLRQLADGSDHIAITVNGGAYGLGTNGIHHLDYFLFLTGRQNADVRYAHLFDLPILSGRGERFRDFGGNYLVENERGSMLGCCLPASSAAPVMTIVGQNFTAIIDERTLDWTLTVRKPESTLPVFRCGADYVPTASGEMKYLPMDATTGLWADGEIALPNFTEATAAHDLLHAVLEKGGARGPYHYT
jgi:predicted dehydrogenase